MFSIKAKQLEGQPHRSASHGHGFQQPEDTAQHEALNLGAVWTQGKAPRSFPPKKTRQTWRGGGGGCVYYCSYVTCQYFKTGFVALACSVMRMRMSAMKEKGSR